MLSYLNPVPTFPSYSGPHKVGSTVYEIPVSELPSSSSVPDPDITTIKFRLFYPTTDSASSLQPIYWLPEPQIQWTEAYASFLGANPFPAKLISYIPALLHYTTIPAVSDAPLLPSSTPYPVVVFSHGLGGNCNAYSAILGNLASCGVICVAPEHRDGSSPISFIADASSQRSGRIPTKTIPYHRLSHNPNPQVLASRNDQLRIRLWELELLYTAMLQLNSGSCSLTNFASSSLPTTNFTSSLNLSPSSITWSGHSFGAATMVQFTKSIFWHEHLPTISADSPHLNDPSWNPLYKPAVNSELRKQITPTSPLALLDLWTMPLRGDVTKWLWDLPLPCYSSESPSTAASSVLAIMSQEFYNYTDLLQRTRALLSSNPLNPAASSSSTRPAPHFFLAPQTAHLSQSDFGLLFPWLTRYFLRAEQPARTITLNSRAMLQLLRQNGLPVASLVSRGGEDGEDDAWVAVGKDGDEKDIDVNSEGSDADPHDDLDILDASAIVEGWRVLSLVGDQ